MCIDSIQVGVGVKMEKNNENNFEEAKELINNDYLMLSDDDHFFFQEHPFNFFSFAVVIFVMGLILLSLNKVLLIEGLDWMTIVFSSFGSLMLLTISIWMTFGNFGSKVYIIDKNGIICKIKWNNKLLKTIHWSEVTDIELKKYRLPKVRGKLNLIIHYNYQN
jgi:hypothetical protein